MIYLKYGIIIFIMSLFFLASCDSKVINKNGEKYIENLQNVNNCWDLTVIVAKESNIYTAEDYGKKIWVTARGCSGILNINSVAVNDSIIYALAEQVCSNTIELSKYTGIVINLSNNSKDVQEISYEFDLKNGSLFLKQRSAKNYNKPLVPIQ